MGEGVIKRLRELLGDGRPWSMDEVYDIYAEDGDFICSTPYEDGGYPNASLIVEMRNALPALLDRLEKLEAVAGVAQSYITALIIGDLEAARKQLASIVDALTALDVKE